MSIVWEQGDGTNSIIWPHKMTSTAVITTRKRGGWRGVAASKPPGFYEGMIV